jgi:hypothetical protein
MAEEFFVIFVRGSPGPPLKNYCRRYRLSLNLRGGEGIEGVGAQGQGEEIGIPALEMTQVSQPFLEEQDIAPLHVPFQVLLIGLG